MSYDLFAFDPSAAPRDRKGLLQWLGALQEDNGEPPSDDLESLTPPLRAWFREVMEVFPSLNGPHSTENYDDPKATDYELNRDYVVACLAYSQANVAFSHMKELAEKHHLGFFNISSPTGELWLPSPDGKHEQIID